MNKIAIVYWSGTGNTEEMAKLILEGAMSKGAEVDMYTASEFSSDKISLYKNIAFGCPSMGDEVLEEGEFEPMFESVKSDLKGKKIALFGSYGWGDGLWMRNWEEDCINSGCMLACEPVISNSAPDGDVIDECKQLGEILATA